MLWTIGAGGNVLQGKGIAEQNIGFGTGHDFLPDFQTIGVNDVALFAIRIVQQRDARRTVGIVFDRRHRGRDAELVALEIDHAVRLLVPAADEARSHAAGAVAAAGALLRFHQRLFRRLLGDVVARQDGLKAPRRGYGSVRS